MGFPGIVLVGIFSLSLSFHPLYAGWEDSLEQVELKILEVNQQRLELKAQMDQQGSFADQTSAPYLRMTELSEKVVGLEQIRNRLHVRQQFGELDLDGSDENEISEPQKQEAFLYETYAAKQNLLKTILARFVTKVTQKADYSHKRYDNRHFQPLKIKRKLKKSVQEKVLRVASDRASQLLDPFVRKFTVKINALPTLQQINARIEGSRQFVERGEMKPEVRLSLLQKEISLESEKIQALKTEIIHEGYQIEELLQNGIDFTTSKEKLRKKLLKYHTNYLNAFYEPPAMKDEERKVFLQLKKELIDEGRKRINQFFYSQEAETLSPAERQKKILEELDPLLTQFRNSVTHRLNEIKGSYGYLGEWNTKLENRLEIRKFASLFEEDEKSDDSESILQRVSAAPFPLLSENYSHVKLALQNQKRELFKKIEKDLRTAQAQLEKKASGGTDSGSATSRGELLDQLSLAHEDLLNKSETQILQHSLQAHYVSLCTHLLNHFKKSISHYSFKHFSSKMVLEDHQSRMKNRLRFIVEKIYTTSQPEELKNLLEDFEKLIGQGKKDISVWFEKLKDELPYSVRFSDLFKRIQNLEEQARRMSGFRGELKELSRTIELQTESDFSRLGEARGVCQELQKRSVEKNIESDSVFRLNVQKAEKWLEQAQKDLDIAEGTYRHLASASEMRRWVQQYEEKLETFLETVKFPNQEKAHTELSDLASKRLVARLEYYQIVESFSNPSYFLKEELARFKNQKDALYETRLKTLSAEFAKLALSYDEVQAVYAKERGLNESVQENALLGRGALTPQKNIFLNTLIHDALTYEGVKDPEEVFRALMDVYSHLKALPEHAAFESGSRHSIQGAWEGFSASLVEILAAKEGSFNFLDQFEAHSGGLRAPVQQPDLENKVSFSHKTFPTAQDLTVYRPLTLPYLPEALVGLKNFGTTCYLNAILKAILTTKLKQVFYPGFSLRKMEEKESPETKEVSELRQSGALFFSALSVSQYPNEVLAKRHEEVINRIGALLHLEGSAEPLRHWKSIQRDAHEILVSLLSPLVGGQKNLFSFETGALTLHDHSPNLNLYEPDPNALTLNLAINEKFNTIQSMLLHDYESERIDLRGSRDYQRTYRITRAPEVLMVSIPRLRRDSEGSVFKDSHPIDVHPDVWLYESEVQSVLTGQKDSLGRPVKQPLGWQEKGPNIQYRLKGTINHHGDSLDSGHYTYAEFISNGDIVMHNDDTVTLHKGGSHFEKILASFDLDVKGIPSNCYLLIYERVR